MGVAAQHTTQTALTEEDVKFPVRASLHRAESRKLCLISWELKKESLLVNNHTEGGCTFYVVMEHR